MTDRKLAHTAKLVLLLAVTGLTAAKANAQQADTGEWVCEFCPFESGQRQDLAAGATNVSDDSAYFGDATGYAEAGGYANLDGNGSVASENHRLLWQVEDLGLDSRYAELSGARPGVFDYQLSYRQLPLYRFFTTDTIFRQSAAATLALPSGWVRAPVTSEFTELDANLARRNIESERRTLNLGGSYRAPGRFVFSANYRRQEHDGVGVYGGSFYTQSSLLPGGFDYVTDIVDFGVGYAGDNSFLSLDYYVSEFDNSYSELRWENPFTGAAGAETASLAQTPDNSYQQLSLSGNYRFANHPTVISYTAARGRMDQNASFLPYTSNANLTVSALPRASLDAEVDTTNMALSLSSKVHRKARLKFVYRYDERDNATAQDQWTRVIADTFNSGESETNTPYSFKRSRFGLSGDVDLLQTLRVSAGYDRKDVDRDFQEVAEQTEDIGWGRVRWRPNQVLEAIVRGGASERDIDSYNESVAADAGQNPLLRKYNLAYRYRRFGELTVNLNWPESPVSLTIDGIYADDDYSQSRLGLTSGVDGRVAADLSWALSGKTSLYVTGGYENIESDQAGSEQFAEPDWRARHSDYFYTAGAGFRARQIADKFDLQLDYMYSSGRSEITLNSDAAGESRFPNLETNLDYLRLRLAYRRSEKLEFDLNMRYQRFVAEDWALEGVGPATIPVILTMGAQPYDEEVVIVGLGFRYLLGSAKPAGTE